MAFEGSKARAAENRALFLLDMFLHELTELVDHGERIQVALTLRLPPGEQSMTAENDAVTTGILLDGRTQHHCELESWPLPRNPNHFVVESAIKLLHLRFPIGGCGERYAPIGMQVIYMTERQESVQGR